MPRVTPEDDNPILHPHHHTPNRHHYDDVAHGRDKTALLNFEKYTARDTETEGTSETPRFQRRSNESGGTHGRSRRSNESQQRSRDQDRGDTIPSGHRHGNYPPPHTLQPILPTTIPTTTSATTLETSNSGKFIQLDILAFVILMAYALCIIVTVLAIWCYRQDSHWNSIVRTERPFPMLPNEDFFGGRYLRVYDEEEGLRHAKTHLLRENRWLELMHALFMVAFLILTLFQLAAYITRGDEDHSRLIICYYTVFGGLGLIVALFPLLSWHNQENDYKVSSHYLLDYSRRVWKADRMNYGPGLTNGTATDSWTLGQIMKFCYSASQDGVTIEESTDYFALFMRRYRLPQLQYLGFCTHHKFKIVNTILSTIFALICCAIPCIYCFQMGEKEQLERSKARTTQKQRLREFYTAPAPPPPGPRYPPPHSAGRPHEGDLEAGGDERPKPRRPRHKTLDSLTERERNEIEKFRRYVEGDD